MGLKSTLFILFVFIVAHETNGANILSLFHTPSKSHSILGLKLAEGLVKKGHHVTFVSPFKFDPMENLTLVNLKAVLEHKEKSDKEMTKPGGPSIFSMVQNFLQSTSTVNELFWNDPNIQKVIKEKPKYDLVIVLSFLHDAMLGIGHHLGAPTIVFNLVGSSSFWNQYVANPTMVYSRNPLINVPTDKFWGRLSTVFGNMAMGYMSYQTNILNQGLLDKYLPNSPQIYDLQRNVSVVLANSHVSIEPARPYVPNMIQIGGFHVQNTKPLPDEFRTFLDGAEKGAILFSLGSNIKVGMLGEERIKGMLKVLGEVSPMRVIFKTEMQHENVPKNIMVKSWVPQADILAHPNLKLFITHGGLGGVTESVYHGVPLLGIPFFGDQISNLDTAEESGYGLVMKLEKITEEFFREKISEILNNPKYTQNVKRRSALIKEPLVKQMDVAIFWIEHVIKFGGGSHLKNDGADLSWYQLYMVDIYIFCTIVLILLAVINIYLVKFILKTVRRLLGKSAPKKKEE
ncbi:UDP-glycosyltransferase UGT5-like [Harmonia axyridis]|uniref:UDP-glycosyltransferase UGT5-like n=1 Tax=Harmonia axyridis TaxID=115357 RepID=UPI001E278EF9|nr:UDP-glycosyltransferase UGT5-like [Harmonia axyridis]